MPCKRSIIGVRAIAVVALLAAGSTAWGKPLPSSVLEDMQRRTMQKRAEVNRKMLHIQAELELAQQELEKLPQVAAEEGWSEEDYFKAFGDVLQRIAEFQMDLEGINAVRLAIRRHLDWIDSQMTQARQLEKGEVSTSSDAGHP